MAKTSDFLKSIGGLNLEDLQARLEEDKLRLKKLQFAHTLTPLENPMTIRGLRKDIARIQTLITQKKNNA